MSYLASVYQRAANDLAAGMPPEVKAECDRLLGPAAGPHERWVYYVSTASHLDHGSAPVQAPTAEREGPPMNDTPQPATISNAYHRALAREAFERSDMYQDPNSPFWRSSFDALVKVLLKRLGLEAYNAWYDAHFPDDDGFAYTYHAKCVAVEAALKGQAQP